MQSTITVRIWTRQVLESIFNPLCAGVEPVGPNRLLLRVVSCDSSSKCRQQVEKSRRTVIRVTLPWPGQGAPFYRLCALVSLLIDQRQKHH